MYRAFFGLLGTLALVVSTAAAGANGVFAQSLATERDKVPTTRRKSVRWTTEWSK